MAFETLDNLRTKAGGLNDELGLSGDTDNVWGTTAQRNGFLQNAFRKLWPRMGRLTRENVTTVERQSEYTLTTLHDIERIEVVDPDDPTIVGHERVRSWQHYIDEAADPPTIRLLIPLMRSAVTLRCIGYAPYKVPVNGADTCDLPPRLEWVVILGARVEAYRRKVNEFANFERFQNENRANALTPADVLELYRTASREWERAMAENQRNLAGARRAQLDTR